FCRTADKRAFAPRKNVPLAKRDLSRKKVIGTESQGSTPMGFWVLTGEDKRIMELLSHDILIVGGGGAGLRAAIAIGETDPKLQVGVISKVYPMRSHTVSAEGGAAAVIKANDSLDAHARDTITGSDWLADQDAVEVFVKEAPAEMIQLEHWGCPWSR